MRLLAPALGLEPDALVARIAVGPDAAIVASLDPGARPEYEVCRAEARRQLVAGLGDPAP